MPPWTLPGPRPSPDPRIQVHVNEANLGDYPNRNRAASLARGTYLKYLDADDMLGRWTLDMMVDAMDMHPDAALGLVDYSRPAPHWPEQLSPEEAYRPVLLRKNQTCSSVLP